MTRLVATYMLVTGLALIVAACGGRATSQSMAPSSPSMAAPATSGSPRDQIQALDRHIQRLRASAGMPVVESGGAADSAADAGSSDPPSAPTTAPSPMGTGGDASACNDVCTISRAICDDAARICRIADSDLAGDPWAADMCKQAQASCTDAKQRCADCKAQ